MKIRFKRKEKAQVIPKTVFEQPHKYRFTFVPEGSSYFEGYVVNISSEVKTVDKAYFIACKTFLGRSEEKKISSVAIFYSDLEHSFKDVLYRSYTDFHETKLKKRFWKKV